MKRKLYFETLKPFTPRWRVMGASIVLVCLAFTFVLWYFLDFSNKKVAEDRLASDATAALDVLETRVEVYGDILYGTRALLLAQPNLTREQWEAYTQSQGLFDRYPGLNSISYARVEENSQAASILTAINDARREGEPEAAITPDTPTDRLGVITNVTNVSGSRRAIGVNLYAREYLAPTLDRADSLGVPTASPPFASRAAERQGTNDFIIALAIYDGTFRQEMSDEQKSAAVTGYAIASLHPETLFNAAVNSMPTAGGVFVQATSASGAVVYETDNTIEGKYIERKSTINIGDEDWYIIFRAADTYELTPREILAPTFFATGGTLFMIMLVTIYFYRQGLRARWTKTTPKGKPAEVKESARKSP